MGLVWPIRYSYETCSKTLISTQLNFQLAHRHLKQLQDHILQRHPTPFPNKSLSLFRHLNPTVNKLLNTTPNTSYILLSIMCNGHSTRVSQGGSIAVLRPTLHFTHPSPEEMLLFFSNRLSSQGTSVECEGWNHPDNQREKHWVVIQYAPPHLYLPQILRREVEC